MRGSVMEQDKYKRLTEDMKYALNEGKKAVEGMEDRGTCNFDSPTLFLKGFDEGKAIAAIEAAGSGAWRYRGEYIISPCISAQGEPRTVKAEKIASVLRLKGYDAGMYYQMD